MLIKIYITKNIRNIKFNDSEANNLYYQTSTSINYHNLSNEENKTLVQSKGILDYLPKDRFLYYIANNQNSTKLVVLNLEDNTSKTINIPTSKYSFIHPESNFLNLYDNVHQILYIINPFAPIRQLKETVNNINKSSWINNNKLLYANDFEIWTLDINTLQKTILTRISHKIEKIIWHPNNNYVIYSTNNSINIIELDDRDRYNITKLIELNVIKDPFLNTKGDTLYFYSKIGNQEGLHKLLIQ